MFDFIYYVKFYLKDDLFKFEIALALENLITPVYKGSYQQEVLNYKEEFSYIYNEVRAYFTNTKIKISNTDLRLFHATLQNFDLPLPMLEAVFVENDIVNFGEELTPKEKLFLMKIEGASIEERKNDYWIKEYHVDPALLISTLEKTGYLTTKDYKFNFSHAATNELVEVLHKYKLQFQGTKEQIRQFLQIRLTEQQLSEAFTGTHLCLTNKGREVISNCTLLEAFHLSSFRVSHRLSINEFYLVSVLKPDYNVEDISKLLIINQNKTSLIKFDWKNLFNDKPIEPAKVVIEEEFREILMKYGNISNEEINVPKPSFDEFSDIINREKGPKRGERINREFNSTLNKLEKPEFNEIKIVKKTGENERVYRSKSFLRRFLMQFILSVVLSVIVLYFFYNFVFEW